VLPVPWGHSLALHWVCLLHQFILLLLPLLPLPLECSAVGKLPQVYCYILLRLFALCMAAVCSSESSSVLYAAGTVHLPQHCQHTHIDTG
jgi:hypothetical protein